MLESLILLTFFGFILASQRKIGVANPFKIYFALWFILFLSYFFLRETFVPVPLEFFLVMICAKSLAFVLLLLIYFQTAEVSQKNFFDGTFKPKKTLLLIAQIVPLLAAPLVYFKAVSIAGGDDIFTVIGYVKLRSAMTADGESFGVLSYFSILSFVVASVVVGAYLNRWIGLWRVCGSIAVSLFYVYVSTGRTFALLFFSLLAVPLILTGVIRGKGIICSTILVVCAFAFVTAMTAKGISVEADAGDNISSFSEQLRAYVIAPLIAFSRLVNNLISADFGLNTFRLVFSILKALGIIDAAPAALIRDYEFVPDPTNVYTVYDAYFRDFSFAGIFIPPTFLLGHWWLYQKAKNYGDKWIYYYSASVYPLVMQFFQDQYFSLLSMWVQIGFWYWLLLDSRLHLNKNEINS